MTRTLQILPLVVTIAALSMGNQSCQQAQDNGRHLKMSANVGVLDAQDFTLPSGQTVDFKYLANQLFSNQVYQHDYFMQMNQVTSVISTVEDASTSTSTAAKVSTRSAVSVSGSASASTSASASAMSDAYVMADAAMLLKYGFGKKAAASKLARMRAASDGTSVTSEDPGANVPACLYQTAQATIGGAIVSFEQTGGGGASIGYNPTGSATTSISAGLQITSSSLDMVVNASNDLWGRQIASIDAQKTNTKISFSLGLDMLGLNYVMQTPIASTVKADMTKALDALVADFSKKSTLGTWASAWESRVIYAPGSADDDNIYAISGGLQSYIKAGDEFRLTNMYTQWTGAPCQSTLADTTIANPTLGQVIVKVIEAGQYSSIAQIVGQPVYEGNILPGAQVKIEALASAATPTPTPTATPSN